MVYLVHVNVNMKSLLHKPHLNDYTSYQSNSNSSKDSRKKLIR